MQRPKRKVEWREPAPASVSSEAPASELRSQRRAPVTPEQFRPIVEASVRRLTSRTDPEYEDLVQSALEGVLGAMEARGSGEHAPQWVSAVARNIAIDKLRARTRERRVFRANDEENEREPSSERSVEPEHLTDVRRELRRFDGALRGIGPARAMVLYLHDVLGYQLAEIAEALGLTPAAAQSRLVRGRRALIRGMKRRPKRATAGKR